MGQEIPYINYSEEDFSEFKRHLTLETRLLTQWLKEDVFSKESGYCGFELEACIVDQHYQPALSSSQLLALTDNPQLVPELAKFNIEFNSNPFAMAENVFSKLHSELAQAWQLCSSKAHEIKCEMIAIGILPTIENDIICMESMSSLQRYLALNQQIMQIQPKNTIEILIEGHEELHLIRKNIMLEAAATSLQIHLQINPQQAKRFYNAALILSAPMVALSGNSPYLFQKDLWYETRIPMFEQSISAKHYCTKTQHFFNRVTFGSGYVKESLAELYCENLRHYPTLLPITTDTHPEWLSHLRLHNGTIWRWNRPVVGMDAKGNPHLRIEHRVPSSGPSIPDMIAHMAFYMGLIYAFAEQETALENVIPFQAARNNFYAVAKHGLQANVEWDNERHITVKDLLLESLIPLAKKALLKLGINRDDVNFYIDECIQQRLNKNQTGSHWQRGFIHKHGRNFQEMVNAYIEWQKKMVPISQWKI